MDKKYYTPSIEEFHVGFEYEISNNEETYERKVVEDTDEFYRLKTALKSLWVRVKCLDREDIESLGWKYVWIDGMFIFTDFEGDKWRLYLGTEYNNVNIYLGDICAFSGTIRNRSELKKVMQMVKIK